MNRARASNDDEEFRRLSESFQNKDGTTISENVTPEILAAQFMLGWASFNNANQCGTETGATPPTAEELQELIKQVQTQMSPEEIEDMFGVPESDCQDYDSNLRYCRDEIKTVGYYSSKEGKDFSSMTEEEAFDFFKKVTSKQYASPEEELKRKATFTTNLKELKKQNEAFSSKNSNITPNTIDQFSDCASNNTETNCVRSGFDTRDDSDGVSAERLDRNLLERSYHWANDKFRKLATPTSVDYLTDNNPVGHALVTDGVRNQNIGRGCDNCYIISTYEVAQAQWAKKSGEKLNFAPSKFSQCDPKGRQNWCNPAGPGAVMKYINSVGASTVQEYTGVPVQITKTTLGECGTEVPGACTYKIKSGGFKNLIKSRQSWETGTFMSDGDLMHVLATVGPVMIAVQQKFFYGHNSPEVFTKEKFLEHLKSKDDEPDHIVTLVGYGTTDKGVDYWTIKNSWGTAVHDRGYIKVERGQVKYEPTGKMVNVALIGSFVWQVDGIDKICTGGGPSITLPLGNKIAPPPQSGALSSNGQVSLLFTALQAAFVAAAISMWQS